jgi:hypothetical protein
VASDGIRSSRLITQAERLALVNQWRRRADRLDEYARGLRREGDPRAGEDAEQAASEYRAAADELEAGT